MRIVRALITRCMASPTVSAEVRVATFLFAPFAVLLTTVSADAAGSAPAPAVTLAPVALDVQLVGDAQQARIAFTVSAPLSPRVSILDKPDRIVLDLPEVNFPPPSEAARKGKGLVRSMRYGMIAPGRSRVVVELLSPALPVAIVNTPVDGGAAQIVAIDIRRVDKESFARALVNAIPPAAPEPAPPKPAAADKRPVIVLDPGHGGIDTGAIGVAQMLEKDVVLGFARELKSKLEKTGQIRVVMTREGDRFIGLAERVRVAQANQASLFVSIHADTLAESPEVRGLTVYTNAERASDAQSARLAEKENLADTAGGLDSPGAVEEVAGILGELTLRETRSYSHLFARTLVGQIESASKLNKNPHRYAGFRVLRAPDVPSALVELGYLSSKSDVELMKTAAWRDKASDAIATSIVSFLEHVPKK